MKLRKLILPLLVAVGCVAAGLAGSAVAAPHKGGKRPAKAQVKRLPIEAVAVAGKAGPLVIRVAADVKTTVHLKVNGSPVGHPFEQDGRDSQTIELRATDHLRAGSNRLSLSATRIGVKSTAKRTVGVPRWSLRADAGEDSDSIVHTRARLGTSTPLGAAGGRPADYRWHIVSRPGGSKATLSDTDAARPVLHAKTPGSYLLQETVDPEGGSEPTSYDQVSVSVAPDDPPLGVYLNTLNPYNGTQRILVGGDEYGGGSGFNYVVLERTTRAVAASGNASFDAAGISQLAALADRYGGGANYMRYLMIVSGGRGVPEDQLANFSALLKKLGGALLSEENFGSLKDGREFSVIGMPGAPAGAATVRIPGAYQPKISGSINGYLTKNQAVDFEGTPLYDYNAGAQPNFDTRAAGSSATTNKMVINGGGYQASLRAGATAGFHVVVVDSLEFRPLVNGTIPTNGTGLGDIRTLQKQAAKELNEAITKPGGPLVFVQTIGKPKAAGPEWREVVEAFGRLGANPQLINALDGTSEYAIVSRIGAKAPPAESSTAYDKGPYGVPDYPAARLVGSLVRSRTSNYVPNVYSTPTTVNPTGGVNLELMNLAYQQPQPWPALAPGAAPGEADAAAQYICEGLNFCQPTSSCPSVRECFWQRYGADWNTKYTNIFEVKYVDGKGFSKPTFDAVRDELAKEIKEVANVKHWLVELQEPLNKSSTSSYVDLQSISNNIYNSLQRPPVKNTTSWVLGLFGKVSSLGTFAGPPASAGAAGIAATFGLFSYLSNETGQPILGSEVRIRSDALAGEMVERISAARKTISGLGMLIFRDYGKLSSAYRHVDSDWALPEPEVAGNQVRKASKQWFWETLLPTAYPYLIRANNGNARNLDCQMGAARAAWPNQPDMFQMNAITGYDTNGNPISSDFFFARGIGGASSPPAQIGDELFRPAQGPNPGLGVEKLQFFTPRVFNGTIYHAFDHSYYCGLSQLPGEF